MTAPGRPDALEDARDSAQGWRIVAFGVCTLTTVWGAVFSFTVYADRLAATFGLSAVQVSSVFSITSALLLVAGGIFGVFAARFTLRPVVATAGVGLGVAAALFQVVHAFAGVVVAFALLGMAGGTAFTVVISLVPQWFDEYQGRATGITMTGTGLGVLLLPFVWLWLFARTDFRTAITLVVGAATLVVLASSFVYRRPPGLARDGATIGVVWLRSMVGDPRFLGAAVGYGLLWGWYYVLSSQLVGILTTAGIGPFVAAAAFSAIGGVSILARVGGGVVGDRVGMRETFVTGVALAGACVFVLPMIHGRLPLYLVLVGFGVGNGVLASLWAPIALTRFGPENSTAIIGLLNVASAASAFVVPLAVSEFHRFAGGYTLPLVTLSIVTIAGVVLFYWGTASG